MLRKPQGSGFTNLFSSFDIASRRSVVAAVSGGSDSTALLLLLRKHLRENAPGLRLVAVTVDHALRSGSAAEAENVAQLCKSLDLPHKILKWEGEKPSAGLPAAARQARHALLAQAARDEETDLVLTGHTADDQAETVLMRMERDEARRSARGLAGIAPATLYGGGTWFIRPLLCTRRETLRSFLRKENIGWSDDPTNSDQRFERPRLRKALAEGNGESAIREALDLSRAAAKQRKAIGEKAAALIRTYADSPAPGLLRLHADFLRAEGREEAIYALRILLAVTGGTPYLPGAEQTAALCTHLAEKRLHRSALSRTLIDRRKTELFLTREIRDLPPLSGSGAWDGRHRIEPDAGITPFLPEGPEPGRVIENVPESLLRIASAAQPPSGAAVQASPIMAPWACHLPSFDIAPARAVARLIGADKVPSPPFRKQDCQREA